MIAKEVAKARIARRIASEFQTSDNMYFINLGIGIPTMVADYVNNPYVFFQAENGMLGVGPLAESEKIDPQLINASRQNVIETDGCSYFDSAASFGLIRGGHIDATVLGAYEVDEKGYIANWNIPDSKQLGVGGAMDLIYGAKRVIIAMQYFNKKGQSKLKAKCTLPITGWASDILIVTEIAVFSLINGHLILEELSPETNLSELQTSTDAKFEVSPNLKLMQI